MYTGTEKKAVVIKADKNSIFESACFILKDDLKSIGQSEMVREANKILKNHLVGGYFFEQEKSAAKAKNKSPLVSFLLGALTALVFCAVLFIFAK